MINYWYYPGLKKGKSRIKKRHQKEVVSEDFKITVQPKWFFVSIWKDLQLAMNLKPKDAIDFIKFDERVYIVKVKSHENGYSLFNNNKGRSLRCEPRKFVKLLMKEYGIKKTTRFNCKKTRSQLHGFPMFEVMINGHLIHNRKSILEKKFLQ